MSLLRGLLGAGVVLVSFVASLLWHLNSPLGRRIVRAELLAYVNGEIRGHLAIEAFDVLWPWQVRAHGVVLRDANGEVIIAARRLRTSVDLLPLLGKTLRFAEAKLDDGAVYLRPDAAGDPTLLSAFDLRAPSPKRPGHKSLSAVVDGIRTERFIVEGELLGLRNLRLRDVQARGRMQIAEHTDIRIDSVRAVMVQPYPFAVHIDQLSGWVHSDWRQGLKLHARLHTSSDRLRALIVYRQAPAEAVRKLDLRLALEPLWLPRLQELGFAWASRLHGLAHGSCRLWGPVADLRVRADLTTTAGALRLQAHMPPDGSTDLVLTTPGVQLARLLHGAPDWRLALRGKLHVPAASMPGDPTVTLEVEPWRIGSFAVPALRIEGNIGDEAFVLHRGKLMRVAGDLQATGRIAYSGDADLHVQGAAADIGADRYLRRLLPDVRGSLAMDAQVQVRSEPRWRWRCSGSMRSTGLRYGIVSAQQLSVQGVVQQSGALQVDAEVRSRGLALRDYQVGDGTLRVKGRDPAFQLTGNFTDAQQRLLAFALEVQRSGRAYVLHAPHLELGLGGDQLWRGEAQDVRLSPGQAVDVGRFWLANGSQRLEAHGHLDLQGAGSDAEALLQDLDLRVLRGLLGERAPKGGGKVDARWVLRGHLSHPDLMFEGALRDGSFATLQHFDAVYLVHLLAGRLAVDAQVQVRGRGSLSVTGGGIVDGQANDLLGQLWGGSYEVETRAEALDLLLLQSVPGLAAWQVQGRVSGALRLRGSPAAPSLNADLRVPDLQPPGWSLLGLHTQVQYEQGVLAARLELGDAQGALLESEGSLLVDVVRALQQPSQTWASLDTVPWRFAMRLPVRSLAQWPEPLRGQVPEVLRPLRLAANATLAGGAFEPRGELQASLDWFGHLLGLGCGGVELPPHADVRLTLRDGLMRGALQAFVGTQRVVEAKAEAPASLARWAAELGEGRFSPPPLQLQAFLRQAPLQRVPGLCRYAAGRVEAMLEASQLWTPQATWRWRLTSGDLRLRRLHAALRGSALHVDTETAPMRVQLSGQVAKQNLQAAAELRWASGARGLVRADVPVRWVGGHALPLPRVDAPLKIDADLERAPLDAFVAWVPQLVEVDGEISGRIRARSLMPVPDVSGDLLLRQGAVRLYGIGHRLHDMQGKVRFQNRRVQFEGVQARDAKGRLRLDGSLEFASGGKARAHLVLKPNTFPLRREASVIGTLSGEAVLDSRWDREQLSANLVLRQLDVQVPDDASSDLQSLDRHPDVQVFGEAADAAAGKPYPVRLYLDASRPFSVRSGTFRVEMRAEVVALFRDPELTLRGYAELLRGRVEIYGKRFEIERGSIEFDGGTTINPEVSLVLTHRLRNPPGATVSVIVSGRLSTPSIRFASSETSDQTEIIGLLVGGRNTRGAAASTPAVSQQVGSETAAFLTGLTYGLASLTARKQLGELFPVISIENNPSVYGGSRARFGFQADELIPPKLQNFVRGIYVEGSTSLSSNQQSYANTGTVQGRGLGFLLQLEFPYSIFGTGAFAPPDNWGLDLTWEP